MTIDTFAVLFYDNINKAVLFLLQYKNAKKGRNMKSKRIVLNVLLLICLIVLTVALFLPMFRSNSGVSVSLGSSVLEFFDVLVKGDSQTAVFFAYAFAVMAYILLVLVLGAFGLAVTLLVIELKHRAKMKELEKEGKEAEPLIISDIKKGQVKTSLGRLLFASEIILNASGLVSAFTGAFAVVLFIRTMLEGRAGYFAGSGSVLLLVFGAVAFGLSAYLIADFKGMKKFKNARYGSKNYVAAKQDSDKTYANRTNVKVDPSNPYTDPRFNPYLNIPQNGQPDFGKPQEMRQQQATSNQIERHSDASVEESGNFAKDECGQAIRNSNGQDTSDGNGADD